jgi:hypothetical protein
MPCGRSRRLRAPSYVRPRSPRTLVAQAESAPVVNEWTAVPGYPARLFEPFGSPRPRGKMRLPSFCNQQPLRAPSGPLDSRCRFRPRVEARLTTSPELQHGLRRRLTAAERARSCGGLRSKSPSRAAHPVTRGLFGRGQVACLASDAPCRTLSPVIEPQGVRAPGPVPPLPRQRSQLSRSEAPGWYAPFHHSPSRAREGPRPGAAGGPIMTSTSLAQGARPSERSAASPRFRGARRLRSPKTRSPERCFQLCNPMRSASTAWDRLNPGGASCWEEAEARSPVP